MDRASASGAEGGGFDSRVCQKKILLPKNFKIITYTKKNSYTAGLEGFSSPTGKAAMVYSTEPQSGEGSPLDGGGRAEPRPGKPRQDVEAWRASPASDNCKSLLHKDLASRLTIFNIIFYNF